MATSSIFESPMITKRLAVIAEKLDRIAEHLASADERRRGTRAGAAPAFASTARQGAAPSLRAAASSHFHFQARPAPVVRMDTFPRLDPDVAAFSAHGAAAVDAAESAAKEWDALRGTRAGRGLPTRQRFIRSHPAVRRVVGGSAA